jgi:hypothetical protein
MFTKARRTPKGVIVPQNSINDRLDLYPIESSTRCGILSGLLGLNIRPFQMTTGEVNYESYFSYYIEQCKIARHDGGRHLSAKSHQDIIEIAAKIRSQVNRQDIESWLWSLPVPETKTQEQINGSIDLTVRLLSMINVGELHYGFSGQERLLWSRSSLEHCIRAYFEEPQVLDKEHVKLEKIFNARNLGRIAGIEIQFTNNLADHLRLISEDDKKVAIFHNVSFLRAQQKKYVPSYSKEMNFIDHSIT